MPGIDLTGYDPFSQYMPDVNSVLASTAGDSSNLSILPSLLPSILPFLGSLLNKPPNNSPSAVHFTGAGNPAGDPNAFALSPKTINTLVIIGAVGVVLIVLVVLAE